MKLSKKIEFVNFHVLNNNLKGFAGKTSLIEFCLVVLKALL